MPGYVIHLAVGKVYSKKNKIKNIEDFERGIIAPDLIGKKDKSKSHYGPNSCKPDLNLFLKTNNILTDYNEGYFLHLLTDHLFYNKFLKMWNPNIYEDYDILNAGLIKKYGIILPEEIKDVVKFKSGNLNILNKDEICAFINSVGKIDIRKIVQGIEDIQRKITDEFEI